MLSDRITELFRLLQCSNTEIAHFAGCSPSNISRLKRGLTRPKKGSRAAMHLAEGIYRYADYENMLEMLATLCHTPETGAAAMVPAIAAWLYEEADYEPPRAVTPKSKLRLVRQRQSFGERLDEAMTLLEMTNTQLAGLMNIDPSLVSRYRSGVLYPNRNEQIKEQLCDHLMSRAERMGKKNELAALCGSGYGSSKPGARGGEAASVRGGGHGSYGSGADAGAASTMRCAVAGTVHTARARMRGAARLPRCAVAGTIHTARAQRRGAASMMRCAVAVTVHTARARMCGAASMMRCAVAGMVHTARARMRVAERLPRCARAGTVHTARAQRRGAARLPRCAGAGTIHQAQARGRGRGAASQPRCRRSSALRLWRTGSSTSRRTVFRRWRRTFSGRLTTFRRGETCRHQLRMICLPGKRAGG